VIHAARILPLAQHKDYISVFEPPPSQKPSTKPQAPEEFQSPKHQPPKEVLGQKARKIEERPRFLSLELGASLELGVWNLELLA